MVLGSMNKDVIEVYPAENKRIEVPLNQKFMLYGKVYRCSILTKEEKEKGGSWCKDCVFNNKNFAPIVCRYFSCISQLRKDQRDVIFREVEQ